MDLDHWRRSIQQCKRSREELENNEYPRACPACQGNIINLSAHIISSQLLKTSKSGSNEHYQTF